MKRYLCVLVFLVIFLIFISGCAEITDWEPTTHETVNNFDGVYMTIKEGTVSSSGLTVLLENSSEKWGIYGEPFWVEKKINEKWYQVPFLDGVNNDFVAVGYDLPSGENSEWEVNWEWLYGSLESGDYRIVKDIADYREPGDYDKYYLAAEFTIK